MGTDHLGWFPPLSLRLRLCMWERDRLIDLCVWVSSLWVSVEWVLESHGYLSADWRRKHNPKEEGCCYQLLHAGLRENSAPREAGRHMIGQRAGSTSLTLISFVSLSVSFLPLVCFRPALWPAPGCSSRQSSELHYNVCGGFSAVSTQRYGIAPLFYQLSCFLFVLPLCCFSVECIACLINCLCGLVLH